MGVLWRRELGFESLEALFESFDSVARLTGEQTVDLVNNAYEDWRKQNEHTS